MMRRFIPPPVQSLAEGDPDAVGPSHNATYEAGFDAGKRAGHASGLAEGEALARAASSEEIAELRAMLDEKTACNSVSDALNQLLAARDADRQALERQVRAAVSVALSTLFPSLMSEAIGSEVAALIDQALTARTLENITIRASAETIRAITTRGLPQAGWARVRMLPDSNPTGAVDVAWTGGGMTFDPAALLRRVNEAISPLFMRKDEVACQN